tara:strand:- start:370 stop:1713 length:1344 start_codon:yes stop_codon:yes gene_type:complete
MNRIDNSGTGIAGLGRGGDSKLAHVMTGEMVVPPVISPQTQAIIRKEMIAAGIDPNEYTVGEGMSINPITGLPEFGLGKFLKKAARRVKKVVKKLAPVAAVIPGPWQGPAIMYNRGKAVVNIAKGEGGIGDLITAFTPAKSYTGGKTGNIFGNAKEFLTKGSDGVGLFGNIGKGLSNVGDYVFKGSDDVGLLGNLGKSASNAYEYVMPGSDGKGLFKNMMQPDEFDQLTGGEDIFDPNYGVQPNQPSTGPFGGQIGPYLRDTFLGTSEDPGLLRNIVGGGGGGGGLGGNAGLMAMAALYGKAVKDDYKRKEGGLKDIRQSVRPDLMPAPTFTGFDLGVRKAAMGGLQELRPNFAMGRSVMANELDMRNGGPSIGPGTGTSDDIPAMLSDGEFVMTSAANNGLGGFKVTKTETGIELVPNGQPNRQQGAKNMDKLMKTFEQFNKVGMS